MKLVKKIHQVFYFFYLFFFLFFFGGGGEGLWWWGVVLTFLSTSNPPYQTKQKQKTNKQKKKKQEEYLRYILALIDLTLSVDESRAGDFVGLFKEGGEVPFEVLMNLLRQGGDWLVNARASKVLALFLVVGGRYGVPAEKVGFFFFFFFFIFLFFLLCFAFFFLDCFFFFLYFFSLVFLLFFLSFSLSLSLPLLKVAFYTRSLINWIVTHAKEIEGDAKKASPVLTALRTILRSQVIIIIIITITIVD